MTDTDDTYLVKSRAYTVIDLARALPQRRMPALITIFTEQEARIARDFPVQFPAYGAVQPAGRAGAGAGIGR
jgi:hypothetical protein